MNAELEKLLTDLERSRFFGTVEVHYQDGVPGHAKVTRTLKLDTANRRENRDDNTKQGQARR